MPSSRSLLTKAKHPRKIFIKKGGRPSKEEKQMVAQVVLENPGPIEPAQVQALSKLMHRSKDAIKKMVEEARDNFVEKAKDYVDIHHMATVAALSDGDNETAMKGAQWAMTNIAAEGVRIIDKAAGSESSSPRVMIGINVGGIVPPAGSVKVETIDATNR